MSVIKLVFHPAKILTKVIAPRVKESIFTADKDGATANRAREQLSTSELFEEMRKILDSAGGVGIAAPQVNVERRCFIAKKDDEYLYFNNPEILKRSKSTEDAEEGCLSIPDVFAEVTRPYAVTVRAWDQKGKEFTVDAEGYFARIIQHEYDHLEGILFFSRVSKLMQKRLLRLYKRLHPEVFTKE